MTVCRFKVNGPIGGNGRPKWIFNFELTILEVFSNGPWWNRNRFKQGTKADRFVLNNNMRRIIRSFTDFWITILIFVVHFWLFRGFLSFKFNEPFIVFYDVFWCSWSMVGHKKDNGLDSSKGKFNSCVLFCLSIDKRVFFWIFSPELWPKVSWKS